MLPIQQSVAMNLMEVYAKARTNDPSLRSAQFAYEAAREKLPQARAALLPVLNGYASPQKIDGNLGFADEPATRRRYLAKGWTLELVQPVLRPKNWIALSGARTQLEIAELQLQKTEQELMVRVVRAYFDVITSRHQLQAQSILLRIGQQQGLLVSQSVAAGTLTTVEANDSAAASAQLEMKAEEAKMDVTSKEALFARLIRVGPDMLSLLRSDIDIPMPVPAQGADWQAFARRNAFDVRSRLAAMHLAENDIAKGRAAYAPTVDFVVSRIKSNETGNLALPLTIDTMKYSTEIGLRVNVPLFAGGGDVSRVREAIALRAQAESELEVEQDNAEQRALEAFNAVIGGMGRLRALHISLASSESNLKTITIGLRIGTKVQQDILGAQQQLTSLRRDMVLAEYETLLQAIKLKAAAASLSVDDLVHLDALLTNTPTNSIADVDLMQPSAWPPAWQAPASGIERKFGK